MYVRCRECEIFHGPPGRWRNCPECGAPLAPSVAADPAEGWALVSVPGVAGEHSESRRRQLALGFAFLALLGISYGIFALFHESSKRFVAVGLAKVAAPAHVPHPAGIGERPPTKIPAAAPKAPPPAELHTEGASPSAGVQTAALYPRVAVNELGSPPEPRTAEPQTSEPRTPDAKRPRGGTRSRSSQRRVAATVRNEERQLLPPEDTGGPSVDGKKLEAATALRVVSEQAKAFQSCVDAALKRNPDLAVGVVELRLRVGASGLVQRASVSPAKYRQQPWAKCILETARHIAFPPSSRGTELVVPLKVGVALSP